MPVEIKVPFLGHNVEKGTISLWLKNEGQDVKTGEVIGEIEAEKAVIEIESPTTGILAIEEQLAAIATYGGGLIVAHMSAQTLNLTAAATAVESTTIWYTCDVAAPGFSSKLSVSMLKKVAGRLPGP